MLRRNQYNRIKNEFDLTQF